MSERRGPDHRDAVVEAQDVGHAEGHDYDKGSPHLRHVALRSMVEDRLASLVRDTVGRRGSCRVLEIGGGHGTFTRCLVDAGAEVTVTEVSQASADHLARTFRDAPVTVVHDRTGEDILASADRWDLAVLTAVLHHIPDYEGFLRGVAGLVDTDGGLFTVADPLYYPRMPRSHHRLDRGFYFAWRIFQGNVLRGLATRRRRLQGVYDDQEASDLVEYHVMRDGVDEQAVASLLGEHFAEVEVFPYFSTQAPLLQRLGSRTSVVTDFGVEARGRLRVDAPS